MRMALVMDMARNVRPQLKLPVRLRRNREQAEDSQDKLVELFHNRNEFKRLYEQARVERDRLQDELQSLRTDHGEARRLLDALEGLLADPDRGTGALLYYRLRTVWQICHEQLSRLAQEMQVRNEQSEKARQKERFEKQREARLGQMRLQLESLEREIDALKAGQESLRSELLHCTKIWHHFKRKALEDAISQSSKRLGPMEERHGQLQEEVAAVREARAPEHVNVSLEARRKTNIALIALAQHLYLHFSDSNIAELARAAGTKPVVDCDFGDEKEAQKLDIKVREAVQRLRSEKGRTESLRLRMHYLQQKVGFASPGETVPEPKSVAYILPSMKTESGGVDLQAHKIAVNVLVQDYWGLERVLLRAPQATAVEDEMDMQQVHAEAV